jgi:dimethylglycine dehydrogenase
MSMNSQARIVIVGGGIMGVALAYHLAEEGETNVMLIEKGELTSGSTWHAAGQCPSLVSNYNLAKIHDYGNRLYPTLEEKTGQYVSWHASGGIRVARQQADIDWFHYMKGIADNVGFHMEIIDAAKIKALNPFYDIDGVIAGAWTLDDGHADPSGLTNAMARGATDMGVKIVRHNRVTDINRLPSGEWEVDTELGKVTAEIVVNAAGSFARQVAQMVGADVPIANMEHHYIVTGAIQEFIDRDEEFPVMRDPYASAYIRQEQKSGLIGIYESTGLTEAWGPDGLPPWSSDSELFPDDLDRLMPWLERAMNCMPPMLDAGIKRIVNGAIPHSADGPPLLGPVAGLENFWLCCGSSFGIAQGAGCGKYLAQWMIHGDAEINMTGFDPRRFGDFADRHYMREKGFQDYGLTYATPLPGEEFSAARDCRLSPLHATLAEKGAVFTQTFGWERPQWFSLDGREEECSYRRNNVFDVVRAECEAVRDRVGVIDMTGFAKYDVRGAGAEAFLNRLLANRMPKRDGGMALAHFLSQQGRILGEATVTRIASDHFYLLSAASAELRDLDHLLHQREEGEAVEITNATEQRGVMVVAGPRSRELLATLTDAPLDNASFPWRSAQEIEIAGVGTLALRINYVGELGWELHPKMADLATLYNAVWAAGEAHGIANFGLYALNSLRMEKAYRGWGAELTNEVTMLEADMARFFNDKKDDFIGKLATETRDTGPLQLVYFSVDAVDADVRGGEPIFVGDDCVGVTTSGGYGHAVEQSLGFGYVPPAQAIPGSVLEVGLLDARCQATVLTDPAYDPANQRLMS